MSNAKPPLPNSASQYRKGTYHESLDFVQSLCETSYGLVDIFPIEDRKDALCEVVLIYLIFLYLKSSHLHPFFFCNEIFVFGFFQSLVETNTHINDALSSGGKYSSLLGYILVH